MNYRHTCQEIRVFPILFLFYLSHLERNQCPRGAAGARFNTQGPWVECCLFKVVWWGWQWSCQRPCGCHSHGGCLIFSSDRFVPFIITGRVHSSSQGPKWTFVGSVPCSRVLQHWPEGLLALQCNQNPFLEMPETGRCFGTEKLFVSKSKQHPTLLYPWNTSPSLAASCAPDPDARWCGPNGVLKRLAEVAECNHLSLFQPDIASTTSVPTDLPYDLVSW